MASRTICTRRSRRRGELAVEREPLLAGRDHDPVAVLHLAGEDLLGERVLYRLLDHALERTRPIGRVPALLRQPLARRRLEHERDLTILQELAQPRDLDIDDLAHFIALEAMEQDDLVDTVEEF